MTTGPRRSRSSSSCVRRPLERKSTPVIVDDQQPRVALTAETHGHVAGAGVLADVDQRLADDSRDLAVFPGAALDVVGLEQQRGVNARILTEAIDNHADLGEEG